MNQHISSSTDMAGIDCTVCHKKNVPLETCPRCGAELTILRSVKNRSRHYALLAKKALSDRNLESSLEYALKSWYLMNNEPAAKTVFISLCASGKFKEALPWYGRIKSGISHL